MYQNTCTQFPPLELGSVRGKWRRTVASGAYRVAREPAKAPSHQVTLCLVSSATQARQLEEWSKRENQGRERRKEQQR